MTRLSRALAGLLLSAAVAGAGALMSTAPITSAVAQEQPGLTVETIGPLVREYLMQNPEVLEEVLTALEEKRQQDQNVARSEALQTNSELIFHSDSSPVGGNPDGDVTIVEFFDYNCGYCKRMLPAMLDLLGSDSELKFVFKEWPVLTEGSAEAARIALAVNQVAPERYVDFHVELMSTEGGSGIDKTLAMAIVEDLGIDAAAVEEAAAGKAVDDAIAENYAVAESLGLRGTPSYVIGDEVIPGAVSFEALKEKIQSVRDNGCATC